MSTNYDVGDSIFQLLTRNPNKWASVVSLYNQYISKHTNINKKDFILRCELLGTQYKNVKKYHKNGLCYLAFVSDESCTPKEAVDEGNHADLVNDEIFKSIDKCDVIEYMMKNAEYCDNLSLTEYFDGTDTVLHILFRRGRIDIVNALISCYNVDFDIKNSNDESLIDVINYNDKNAVKLVKLVFENKYSRLMADHNTQLSNVKQANTRLLEVNSRLITENGALKKGAVVHNVYKYISALLVVAVAAMYLLG
jgi:hypothetical protein